MKTQWLRKFAAFAMLTAGIAFNANAQEYVSPTQPVQTGKSPGVKVKLLSSNGQTKNYVFVFATGDEVRSGLTEFAQKYNVKAAHFTGIGDALSMKVGFFDYSLKMFKVIPVDTAEVTSFIGNIATLNGKPAVHIHASAAISDGSVKGGHLLELYVGPTFEIFVTVEPTALNKKLDTRYNAGLIDPALEN